MATTKAPSYVIEEGKAFFLFSSVLYLVTAEGRLLGRPLPIFMDHRMKLS